MASNLCIDIGNSRIKMALLDDDTINQFVIFEHNRDSEINQWLDGKVFVKGIYSSVLQKNPEWLNSIKAEHDLKELNSNLKTPLKIHYKTPESLGPDRIAAMVGAVSQFPNHNLLVVNAGTCVTYDLVNKNQEFIGGNIAPGLDMRWKAMHEFTSALPRIRDFNPESEFLGFNTVTAMQNGGLQGIILEVEGYFNRLKPDYLDLQCIITGGSAHFLVNQLKIDNFAEPYLVLKGLNTILKYQ